MKMQALDGVFVMYLSIERASVDLSVEICAGPKGCSKPWTVCSKPWCYCERMLMYARSNL